MSGVWPQLALVAVLVLVNAALAGSELALVSLRAGQLRRLEAHSSTGAVLAHLAREPNRFLATIQIGITLAGFLASASAAVTLAEPLEQYLGFLGDASRAVAVVAVTLALSYVTLVVGELAPKRVAMQRAERWGLVVARPLSAMATAVRPVVWLLSKSTDLVVRLTGGDPAVTQQAVTTEELRELAAQVGFSPQQRSVIAGAFEISDRTLRQVLRPRPEVFILPADAACSTALADLAASGHSRAPVCRGRHLDEAIGVAHLRDLLGSDPACTAGSVAMTLPFLPETLGALDALRELQRRRAQMAVVLNEHGGAEGIVTVEDLVEELVGEIYDETDRELPLVQRTAEGMVLSGRFPVHELADLGVEVPDGDYATVAGFVIDALQRLPDEPGEHVDHGPWRFTVTGVDRRAITQVRVARLDPESLDPEPFDGERP